MGDIINSLKDKLSVILHHYSQPQREILLIRMLVKLKQKKRQERHLQVNIQQPQLGLNLPTKNIGEVNQKLKFLVVNS